METNAESVRDAEHIQLLAIGHYIMAGLCLLGMCFLGGHYLMMQFMTTMMKNDPKAPREMLAMFSWIWVFYVVFGISIFAGALVNYLSARYMQQRRNRIFSLVVAGLNCLQIPIGAILGAFTLIVLSRESVQRTYAERAGRPSAV